MGHQVSFRVYYEDTDAGGVVYHANHLKFAERARTEWLRSLGIEQSKLVEEEELLFVVYQINVKFCSSAKLDDLLTVKTKLTSIKKASMVMQQEIYFENQLVTSLEVTVACINQEKKPRGFPLEVLKIVSEQLYIEGI